jgi:periplasmic protein TonB
VRCDHCHDRTADDRRRFCEWCGRQLSVREENPIETATAALDDLIDSSSAWSVDADSSAPVETPNVPEVEAASAAPRSARCESCGGPSDDADLCDACQRAFHAVIESKKTETSVEAEADETEEDEFDEEDFDDAFPEPTVQASAPAVPEPPSVAAPVAAAPVVAPFNPWAASPSFANSSPAAQPAAAATPAVATTALPQPPPAAPVVAEAAPAPAAPQTSAPQPSAAPAARPVPARDLTRPMPRPRPVPPGGLPNAPATQSSSGGRTRAVFVAGALIVVALAVCVPFGQPWLASAEPEPAPSEEAPQEAAQAEVAVARPAPPSQPKEPVVDDIAPDPEPPRPVPRPKPARHEPKREAAPAPAPAVEAPAETALPAAEPVAAPAPEPEPAAAPVGPFFETRQVNETPQVASRVEPQIPDGVQGPVNDVVIVRILVSQTGHVSLVNVLRRSKTGVALDDAVVAAVKQWTFSPARKRGEAVSCWYHVGVPVQRAG